MSMLPVPSDGQQLLALDHDQHCVVQLFPTGANKTVVERAQNILRREEALQDDAACNQAILEALQRWLNLGAVEIVSNNHASNVIDVRWVLKWKIVNDKMIIQAWLVVSGFNDLKAAQVSTYAATTTRWG